LTCSVSSTALTFLPDCLFEGVGEGLINVCVKDQRNKIEKPIMIKRSEALARTLYASIVGLESDAVKSFDLRLPVDSVGTACR